MQEPRLQPDYYIDPKKLFDLDGRTALITGSAQGIGRVIGLALASMGADIVLADLNPNKISKVADEVRSLNRRVESIVGDVSNPQDVEKIVKAAIDSFGHIDILVNSAGVGRESIPAQDLPFDVWQRIININLTGSYLMCRATGRHMIKQGSGSIINIASVSGLIANKGRHVTAYCSSKGGVVMLTRALASDWASQGVRVNAIAPGYVNTPFLESALADPVVYQSLVETVPCNRIGKPVDMAGAAVYLASAASDYVTGHVLIVDGGLTVW
jgi:NAD(P)-dependent dehydrogenase (short-subunit alcohol dehydrogenase family)